MRIRLPFAGAFFVLVALSAYLGLSSIKLAQVNDKVLHFVDFFLLTTCFYWVLETSRRRTFNVTLLVCTLILGVGSEFVQGIVTTDRYFDAYDIVANICGSASALGLSTWYHRRMLERKRQAKHYHIVPGDEDGVDLELGEAGRGQQSDVTETAVSVEQELDHWDENTEDPWDEEEPAGTDSTGGEGQATPESSAPEAGAAVDKNATDKGAG